MPRGATFSSRALAKARVRQTVDHRSYRRHDWVVRCPMDRLLRRQRPPVPRLEGASNAHILGAAHRHRTPVPDGVPLSFCTQTRHSCARREHLERRKMMARVSRLIPPLVGGRRPLSLQVRLGTSH
jgi:hypothetical protein